MRVLGNQYMGEPSVEGLAIGLVLRRIKHPGQETQLIEGRTVVERRLEVCTLARVGFGYGVRILGPATRVGLMGKEDGPSLFGFGGSVPSVGLLEEVAGAFLSGGRPSGTGKKE